MVRDKPLSSRAGKVLVGIMKACYDKGVEHFSVKTSGLLIFYRQQKNYLPYLSIPHAFALSYYIY